MSHSSIATALSSVIRWQAACASNARLIVGRVGLLARAYVLCSARRCTCVHMAGRSADMHMQAGAGVRPAGRHAQRGAAAPQPRTTHPTATAPPRTPHRTTTHAPTHVWPRGARRKLAFAVQMQMELHTYQVMMITGLPKIRLYLRVQIHTSINHRAHRAGRWRVNTSRAFRWRTSLRQTQRCSASSYKTWAIRSAEARA